MARRLPGEGGTVESDEEEQDAFVTFIQGFDFDAGVPVIWFVLGDITNHTPFFPEKDPFQVFKDMGLWDAYFTTEKAAWDTWCGP